jgi:drug/metabolite transporter (DMT)-like permease
VLHGDQVTLVALAYLTIAGSCITFSAFTWLNRNARPELASSFSYVNPLVAVLLGALVLGEPRNQGVLLSTILTVGAVLLVMLPPPASRRPKAGARLRAFGPWLLGRESGTS